MPVEPARWRDRHGGEKRVARERPKNSEEENLGWEESYTTAQMVPLPCLSRICGEPTAHLVRSLAAGVGCPEEFIFFPLLACCSAMMGNRSEVRVHAAWSEPPVLWIVIGSGEGTRKSSAMRQVLNPLLEVLTDKISKADNTAKELSSWPAVFTGAVDIDLLKKMLHDSDGCLLHLTEDMELAHRQMAMHPTQLDSMPTRRSELKDLYEAFPGNLTLPWHYLPTRAQQPPELGSRDRPLQLVRYTQCGFARPKYAVTLTIGSPGWLSSRLLVACPNFAGTSSTFTPNFGPAPLDDNDEGDDNDGEDPDQVADKDARSGATAQKGAEDEADALDFEACVPPSAKKAKTDARHERRGDCCCKLRDVYAGIGRSSSTYVFKKDARRELHRFQREELDAVTDHLGTRESGEAGMSKSLGQIVRLAGVLKALTQAVDDATTTRAKQGSCGASTQQRQRQATFIDTEDVSRALTLGKYFIEQKLSMKFMVSTGFFEAPKASATSSQQSPFEISLPPSPKDSTRTVQTSRSQCTSFRTDMSSPCAMRGSYGFPKINEHIFYSPAASSAESTGISTHNFSLGHIQHHYQQQQQNSFVPQGLVSGPVSRVSPGFSPLAHLQQAALFLHGLQRTAGSSDAAAGGGLVAGVPLGAGGNRSLPNNSPSPKSPSASTTSTSSSHAPLPSLSPAASIHALTSSAPAGPSSALAGLPEIDVSKLPATWIPATPEEEMAEMSQAAEFAQLDPAQFVAVHARRVKRLLECFDDGCGVSATTAAQKSIAPPVRVAGTNNRHPAWASALFFQKVADLGLGVAEQVRHPTNGRVYWRFRRKAVTELSEKNYQLLQYLRIDMARYSRVGVPGCPLLPPGMDTEPFTLAGGSAVEHNLEEEGSNSSTKGDGSPLSGVTEIKQERCSP